MDRVTFEILEKVLSPMGPQNVQYWHGKDFKSGHPEKNAYRAPGLVHEGSTMHIGDETDNEACVDLEYKLKGVENVYVTGASLWPASGSWNPTMTMVGLSQHLADKLLKKTKRGKGDESEHKSYISQTAIDPLRQTMCYVHPH